MKTRQLSELGPTARFYLNKYLTNLQDYDVYNIRTNGKNAGFMSNISYLTYRKHQTQEENNIVVKCAFDDEKQRMERFNCTCFENEIHFYVGLHPELSKFGKGAFAPSLLYRNNQIPQCLILENLNTHGYYSVPKEEFFDVDHIRQMMKTYGRFHAASFAFKNKNFKEYTKLIKGIQNKSPIECYTETQDFLVYTQRVFKACCSHIDSGSESSLKEQFLPYVENPAKILGEVWTHPENHYSCILHGDCWSNNLFFNYDDNSKKPTEMKLIDFQNIKVGNPICDLSYALYSCAPGEEFFNLQNYLNIYYDSFCEYMEQNGCDPKKLFPLSVLRGKWQVYSKFGMIMSILTMMNKLLNQPALNEILAAAQSNEIFRKQIRSLILHMDDIKAL